MVPAYANPRKAAEGGANALPGQAVGNRENASPGTVLEGGNVSGPPVDGFARVKEPSAEPAVAAEGDARVGASAAAPEQAR